MIYTDLLKLLLACLLGGLIGYQREVKGMAIGFKTHIIVCVSATLIQIISLNYYKINSDIDVMRLGAQVISGIGFLGVASIIKDKGQVIGLTTAASMWFIASIGLAIGSGIYIQPVIATLIVFIILMDLIKIKPKKKKRNRTSEHFD